MSKVESRLITEIKGLKAEVAQSKARIDELEKTLQLASTANKMPIPQGVETSQTVPSAVPVDVNKTPVYAGDVKGTFKVPGTDTYFGFGGFAKLDVLYSSISMGKDKIGNQRLEVAEIPVGPSPAGDNDQAGIHAKESRVWMKSFTPSQ